MLPCQPSLQLVKSDDAYPFRDLARTFAGFWSVLGRFRAMDMETESQSGGGKIIAQIAALFETASWLFFPIWGKPGLKFKGLVWGSIMVYPRLLRQKTWDNTSKMCLVVTATVWGELLGCNLCFRLMGLSDAQYIEFI